MITLGNFGITIAPLIAIAGAGAFGATMALQGPLSNYGAGLSIIMARPFVVGDTITLGSVSGVVDDISLGATRLLGEDGERILVPNREIVGQIIINSDHRRVVQSKIYLAYDADVAQAFILIREALDGFPELAGEPAAQIGVHDFTYGGIVLGARFWVPSRSYFEMRYKANRAAHAALEASGIAFLAPSAAAVSLVSPADETST